MGKINFIFLVFAVANLWSSLAAADDSDLLVDRFYKVYNYKCSADDPNGPEPELTVSGKIDAKWGSYQNTGSIGAHGRVVSIVADSFGKRSIDSFARIFRPQISGVKNLNFVVQPNSENESHYVRLVIDISKFKLYSNYAYYHDDLKQALKCDVKPDLKTEVFESDFDIFKSYRIL